MAFDAATLSHRFSQGATMVLFGWFTCWLLVGGTAAGKSFFDSIAKAWFGRPHYKAGLPLITIVGPLWISAGLAMLLGRSSAATSKAIRLRSFDNWALVFVVLPVCVYSLSSAIRHVREEDTLDDQIMEAGNAFGYAALISMNVLLVPVTRHSALLKVMGWNPASAVRIHVVTGRMVVIMAWVHGCSHLYRFFVTAGYDAPLDAFVPPPFCWQLSLATDEDPDVIPNCDEGTAECSCYHRWRNVTGIVAGSALLVIVLTSVNTIRRRAYAVFYRIHVLAGPTVLVATILHWDRSILYCCGGILYYLATSLLVILEARSARPVTVHQVDHLTSANRPCVSLTVVASEAAIAQYPVGGYVLVRVAGCSSLSHPLTINLVPKQPGMLRLMFRITGGFTAQLAASASASDGGSLPRIFIEGYQLATPKFSEKHDCVTIIAGGIGITPYLSLLHELACLASSSDAAASSLKRVSLHWICRDASLIEFVQREYLDTLPSEASGMLRICVHSTSDEQEAHIHNGRTEPRPTHDDLVDAPSTAPFSPLFLAPLKATVGHSAILLLAPFSLVVCPGMAGIWYTYNNVQAANSVSSRAWNIGVVVVWSLLVAIVTNALLRIYKSRRSEVEFTPIKRMVSDDEDPDEEEDGDNTVEMVESSTGSLSSSHEDRGTRSARDANGIRASSSNGLFPRPEAQGIRRMPVAVRQGRPSSVSALLRESVDGIPVRKPAVYCCGPSSLLSDVKRATQQSSCLCSSGGPWTLYEESFEL
jgi:predicted ferric reductase